METASPVHWELELFGSANRALIASSLPKSSRSNAMGVCGHSTVMLLNVMFMASFVFVGLC